MSSSLSGLLQGLGASTVVVACALIVIHWRHRRLELGRAADDGAYWWRGRKPRFFSLAAVAGFGVFWLGAFMGLQPLDAREVALWWIAAGMLTFLLVLVVVGALLYPG
jgi:hypothetical protein